MVKMSNRNFFPRRPAITPLIYAYEEPGSAELKGFLKIGFTNSDVRKRVAQQYPTARPGKPPYKIVLEESAMKNDGSSFTDHDIHRLLRKRGFINAKTTGHSKTEWFKCTIDDVKAAIIAIKSNVDFEASRTRDFKMRPEQKAAVEKTSAYFASFWKENEKADKTQSVRRTPHFLWNAKMRFGKTFAAYQLALKMGWKKILVLTFKPAVQSAWEEDIKTHIDFEGWQFISRNGLSYEQCDKKKIFVCIGSFQDYLGKNALGGIKAKNEWVHATNWDCVILDEYHYGAWWENAKELFESEDDREKKFAEGEGIEYFDEEQMPITTNAYLYLSGTPFRALASGEFIEEQIFNWTYSDEQQAKEDWKEPPVNPYAALPRIVLLTYQLPESLREIARKGEYDEFDLNIFFSAEGVGDEARFKYEEYVQKWLDLIRGVFQETTVDNLKLGAKKPPLPFADVQLLESLTHTFWFLPSVSACHAMNNLIKKRNNIFYHSYKIIVAAGTHAGIGINALPPVRESMTDNPLKSKTITLSCGKLTTGVSIKPWTGIFMLRNLTSPETYFQAAFRVQTPWTVKNPDDQSPNKEIILKNECYIFDFAPDRALRQIADYACQLNIDEQNPEKKVGEFIKFLPILSYDGFSMRPLDAAAILEMAMTGTAATLLAKRWESALLVNVDNETLSRLMNNK
jgi:hypothetical protein